MRALRAIAFAAAVGAAAPAHAAADAFLCTPDDAPPEAEWVGESADSMYKNCVQFTWMGFGAALSAPGGMPGTQGSLLGPLVFALKVDSLYPTLLRQMLAGTVLEIELFVRKVGTNLLVTKVSFVDAVIGDLQAAGSGEVPDLTVTIRARTITYTTWTYDASNVQTGTQTVTWTAPGP